MPAQAIWPLPPQTGVSRQRPSRGSRPHTALGALRCVDDGTKSADRAPAPPPRPGGAGLRGRPAARSTASARSTSLRFRAAGSICTWGPDATSHRGRSRLGPWPRSTPTKRRPCVACEPLSVSSRSCGSSTTTARTRTTSPSRRASRPHRQTGKCQVAGGVLRRYTTRWRWFG
jgi:hypothetical protein